MAEEGILGVLCRDLGFRSRACVWFIFGKNQAQIREEGGEKVLSGSKGKNLEKFYYQPPSTIIDGRWQTAIDGCAMLEFGFSLVSVEGPCHTPNPGCDRPEANIHLCLRSLNL